MRCTSLPIEAHRSIHLCSKELVSSKANVYSTLMRYLCRITNNSYHSTKPKKKLIDVYRAVFSLRRAVFTNRPIPNDEGKTSPEDEEWFQRQCNAICATLMFLVCVLDPAVPEENGVYCV